MTMTDMGTLGASGGGTYGPFSTHDSLYVDSVVYVLEGSARGLSRRLGDALAGC
jgi:hypothetical protein